MGKKGEEVDLLGLEEMCEDMWGWLDWRMIKWIYEDDLWKFVSDVIVAKEFRNYFKDVKCKLTNLPLLQQNIWIMNYDIYFFCAFELIKLF